MAGSSHPSELLFLVGPLEEGATTRHDRSSPLFAVVMIGWTVSSGNCGNPKPSFTQDFASLLGLPTCDHAAARGGAEEGKHHSLGAAQTGGGSRAP